MPFLITLHSQTGVTQASIQSEDVPHHLPQVGDDIKYVDENGNLREATIKKRVFNLIFAAGVQQLILVITSPV
jgi:hypothetical protein